MSASSLILKLPMQLAASAALLAMPLSAPAVAQGAQPNILFIMGDDIGFMQPSIYYRGLAVGETPNIDRIGNDGAIFMTTMPSRAARQGAMPSSPGCIRCVPGSYRRSFLAAHPTCDRALRRSHGSCVISATTPASSERTTSVTTRPLPTAHGFHEFWGYLYHLDAMQGVSFPVITSTPTEQTVAPPWNNTPIPGQPEVPGAVDPQTTVCLTPEAGQ